MPIFTIEPTGQMIKSRDMSLPLRERTGWIDVPEYWIKRDDGFIYTSGPLNVCERELQNAIANGGVKMGLRGINGVFG